jgi:hypothetical protein
MGQSINGVYIDTYVHLHDEKKLIDTIYISYRYKGDTGLGLLAKV